MPILMPRDDHAGGTWMGANGNGLWVGLTNRHGHSVDPARRSRGLLCVDLLEARDTTEVVDRLSALDEPYNAFNLVATEGTNLLLFEHGGGTSVARWLEPGVHVITNQPFDEALNEPKALRVRQLLDRGGLRPTRVDQRAPEEIVPMLQAILADHGAIGRDAICLHGGRYGTRSAAVWRIASGSDGAPAVELYYADGPPCSVPFELVDGGKERH